MAQPQTDKNKPSFFLRWVMPILIVVICGGMLIAGGYARLYGFNIGAPLTWPDGYRPYVYGAGVLLPLLLAFVTPAAVARARNIGPPAWGEWWSLFALMTARLVAFLSAMTAAFALRVFTSGRNTLVDMGLFGIPVVTMTACWYSGEIAAWWRRRRGRRARKGRRRPDDDRAV